MNDRNKTAITHEVTKATALWMEERGFKPVETEVLVCRGWCADLAGVITPTQTELIKLKLMPRRPAYYLHGKPNPAYEAWLHFESKHSRTMTCLVEVKTSRGDFCGDRKWKAALPTDLAYLLCRNASYDLMSGHEAGHPGIQQWTATMLASTDATLHTGTPTARCGIGYRRTP